MAETKIDFKQILTDVSARPVLSIWVNFEYSDPSYNKSIKLEHGLRYKIAYIEDRVLTRVVGVIKNITKVFNSEIDNRRAPNEYLITVDCSTNYGANIKHIRSSQIRDIVVYIEHMDEDANLNNTETHGGTTTGIINDAVIDKIVIDDNQTSNVLMNDINGDFEVEAAEALPSDIVGPLVALDVSIEGAIEIPGPGGSTRVALDLPGTVGIPVINLSNDITITGGVITGGRIIKGDIDPSSGTQGGITYGINESRSSVIVIDDTNTGGKIDSGDVVTFTIDITKPFSFTKNDDGTQKFSGTITDTVIKDSHVTGAKSTGGTIVDPVIENPVTYGGTITDSNVIGYNGGSSSDSSSSSGNSRPSNSNFDYGFNGGTASTGSMPGFNTPNIPNEMTTHNGVTKGSITFNGITTGGVVTGGTTIGTWNGRPVSVVNATVIGGVSTGTTINGGTVKGGNISGHIIYGATVVGGSGTAGITTGGEVNGGTISFTIPDVSTIVPQGDKSKEARDLAIEIAINNGTHSSYSSDSTEPDNWVHTPDGLIVTWDPNRGIRSNIADRNAHITPEIKPVY